MSDKAPSDFNDLHVIAGLGAVKKQIDAAVHQAQRSFEEVEAGSKGGDPEMFLEKHTPDVEAEPDEQPPLDVYEDDPEQSIINQFWYKSLDRTEGGMIKPHVANLETILLNDPRWDGVLAYCDFSYRIMMRKKPPIEGLGGEWTDADAARLRAWFHRSYRMPPPARGEISDAVLIASQRHRFHPVREYLKLRWDGESRLEQWLRHVFDPAESKDYLSPIGKKFLIGAVARVMRPGCKMDTVLILEGEQGKGKSTAVSILFGDWFSDAPIPIGEKDAYQVIQGVWGLELAELDSFNKAETTAAKAFFSQTKDRYRPSYGQNAQNFPRQTVCVGTTNQDEYLKDYSGNRRYWPVRCQKVDTQWLTANRDQLWAEAYALYQSGESWWVSNETERALIEDQQDHRLQRDPWEERLLEFLTSSSSQYFSAYQLLTEAIGMDAPHIQRAHQNRIAPIMKALGWERAKKLLSDPSNPSKKIRQRVYVRPVEMSQDDPFQEGFS
ncbi:MAG: virulence-associated E family protein [Candidatus Thiodiazotropha sp. (ex Dulcina madagascariensis)]|nr:virulence-associated E family protein [Candidatus Thiodiazotropha sp. (ex Dulcina madagascariensis)]